jgi:hypothetical protein
VKLPITKQLVTVAPNLAVDIGYRLVVSIDPPDAVRGVWTAFFLEVGFKGMIKEHFLIDELLALQEKTDAEEAEVVVEEDGSEEGTEG